MSSWLLPLNLLDWVHVTHPVEVGSTSIFLPAAATAGKVIFVTDISVGWHGDIPADDGSVQRGRLDFGATEFGAWPPFLPEYFSTGLQITPQNMNPMFSPALPIVYDFRDVIVDDVIQIGAAYSIAVPPLGSVLPIINFTYAIVDYDALLASQPAARVLIAGMSTFPNRAAASPFPPTE